MFIFRSVEHNPLEAMITRKCSELRVQLRTEACRLTAKFWICEELLEHGRPLTYREQSNAADESRIVDSHPEFSTGLAVIFRHLEYVVLLRHLNTESSFNVLTIVN